MKRTIANGVTVTVVILAAGKASRMGPGGSHKLLAEFDGIPLIRRSAITARTSNADAVIVVTGHRHLEITAALDGLDIRQAHNADYETGIAGSLASGILCEQSRNADGVLVFHADMPGISTDDLNELIAVFKEKKGKAVVRAVSQGQRGNPVILPRSLYRSVLRLKGDIGARDIIEESDLLIVNVELGGVAALDVDTQEAVIAAGGIIKA